MMLGWTSNGWEDYLFWQENDRKILKRINKLIHDVLRNLTSLEGIGKPERLKFSYNHQQKLGDLK